MIYSLRNVFKTLATSDYSFSLHIPQLDIEAGRIVAFIGESGCGKTTLMDLLGLISSPTKSERFTINFSQGGSTLFSSLRKSVLTNFRRKNIGYVLQRGGLLPFLTVEQNIRLSLNVNGKSTDPRVGYLSRRLGITEHFKKKPESLSGGQRQRVAIARALAHCPKVLIADEPTAAVDRHTALEIRDLLFETAREFGTTVLIVTHDESLVRGVTDQVFCFDVKKTTPTEVFSTVSEGSWGKGL
jgi:putative ABC transport system ATP-binding protein